MSYCINPNCPDPKVAENSDRPTCFVCGSELLLQGRYRIKRKLSQGGFGTTYEVEAGKEKKVLKVLHKNHPKAVELFQREANVLIELQHPGIPKVETDGDFTFFPTTRKKRSQEPLHCLIMEFIEGVNLHDWMKQKPAENLVEEVALDWLEQLTDIIEEIHKQNYFHRDIKPKNIILKPDGKLVLIDFGAVKELENLENSGTRLISPGYTPPEQIEGKAVPQSDFFSLGRTFVFLLTGKQPKDLSLSYSSNKLEWRQYATEINIPTMTPRIPGGTTIITEAMPPNLPDLIDYLMAFNYKRRPKNTQWIKKDIEAIREFKKTVIEEKSQKLEDKLEQKINATKNLPKSLALSASLLIFVFIASQIYASLRYGVFIANPILMVHSLTSSRFLDKSIRGKIGDVNAIAISPDGEIIASGSHGTIRVWNVKTGELKQTLLGAHKDKVTSLAISPNGKVLVSGSADNTMRLWQIEKGIRILTIPAHQSGINAVAISPDNQIIASAARDGLIRLWNFKTGTIILTLQGHTEAVNSLAFAENGTILVSGSDDGTAIIWNINKGKKKRIFDSHKAGVKALAISPDNRTVASGDRNGTIKVWNWETGEEKIFLRVNFNSIDSLTFSLDGQTLISAGSSIIFWNLNTGKQENQLVGHGDSIASIVLSPDGKYLLSGSADGTIKIWRMP